MKRASRLVAVAVVLVLLGGMGVHYDTTYETEWPYPTTDAIAADYDRHVGQQVFLTGTVRRVDEGADRGEIEVRHTRGSMALTVDSFDVRVQPGGAVQVYGTVRPDHVLAADTVEVVNPAGSSKLYKYGVSLVGAALVVVLFLGHWRIDLRRRSFEVRSDG